MAVAIATGCAAESSVPADLPLIVPPVRAATPAGFSAAAAAAAAAVGRADLAPEISASEFRDRFFNPAGGPTDVFRILAEIDARIEGINERSLDEPHPCLDAAPTEYTLAPFGQSVPFAAQCYQLFEGGGTPPAFMQFGKRGDQTFLFVTGGATRVAARVTAPAGEAAIVDVWYGVGYTNASCGSDGTFDGCSYAVTQIQARPASRSFEMSVAGIGVGFCGIQVGSDGVSIHGRGSSDMGATCGDAASLCVSASDLSATPGACDATTELALPALGRRAGAGAHEFGASTYPAEPNITLDGTDRDSLQFGPAVAPTPGVASFDP